MRSSSRENSVCAAGVSGLRAPMPSRKRPGLRTGWLRRVGMRVVLGGALLGAVAAWADGSDQAIGFEVTVVFVSPQPGGVQNDPRARRIDGLLGAKIRYESLRVLETSRHELALDEIAGVLLPTGQRFRFRALDQGAQGVLVAVDMDTTAQGDFRVPVGKPIILGGNPYQDGQLVVILEHTH